MIIAKFLNFKYKPKIQSRIREREKLNNKEEWKIRIGLTSTLHRTSEITGRLQDRIKETLKANIQVYLSYN